MLPLILTSGPNEVIVVSGIGFTEPAMVTGGRIIVVPGLHTWKRMSLNVMSLAITSPNVYTDRGVPLTVTGVAQVKVASSPSNLLRTACEHFLGKTTDELMFLVKETLEGHQRGIMGSMTVEDIYKERKIFNERVFQVASKDLLSLGLVVLSYTIKDISDPNGYLDALGKSRTAEVMRDARIGEAEAAKESSIKKAYAEEELAGHRFANKTKMALAERDFLLQKSKFDGEVQTEKAVAELAYKLQENITRQKIKEEDMQTIVVERSKKIEVQQEELLRQEKRLRATIIEPALAEKYRMEKIAEATRKRLELEAEASAEAVKVKAEATAGAKLAMAKAENEQMRQKAQAWGEYGEAAILQQYLNVLPMVASKVGEALGKTKSIKMVSSGASGIGALKLTQEIQDITIAVPAMVENMTGIQLAKQLEAIKLNSS